MLDKGNVKMGLMLSVIIILIIAAILVIIYYKTFAMTMSILAIVVGGISMVSIDYFVDKYYESKEIVENEPKVE
jgi:uncharacterized membrane protein